MNHQALRLTPSNSPFFKGTTPRSPTKSKNEEPGLRLKKVIGTTTASANGFDCLPSLRQFAYTAGAAAVVSTVDNGLNVSQRFFRARPAATGYKDTNGTWPMTPTPNDPRGRILGGIREQSSTGSPLGASARDWSDSPSNKTTTAKDRVKAATSVALSPNGRWLAVGETGYKPRILIFSNKEGSNEAPVCILSEHTFGVNSLSFSPDSRYLASLGTVNDGYLFIWSIDERTGAAILHSSNKCTSVINTMTWIGQAVLTIGLRFVKLWKPSDVAVTDRDTSSQVTPRQRPSEFGNSILSPKQKVLLGKNCLLGDLLDANFVSAISINGNKAIVCAESGEICLVDDSEGTQSLLPIALVAFRITAARKDGQGRLHVIGGGKSQSFSIEDLQKRKPTTFKRDRRSTFSPSKMLTSFNTTFITATAMIDNITVELDSKRGIRLTKTGDSDDECCDIASHQLPAHSDAVLGVHGLECDAVPEAAFFTFSSNGAVQLWAADGEHSRTLQIPVEPSPDMYDLTNELRAVAHLPKTPLLAAGDKYGTISLLDISSGSISTQVRAHSAEVVDIVAFSREGAQLIATAGRDRMVQVFAWHEDKLELQQTMDEHAAAVSSLLTVNEGNILLSCSADRTVVVRESVLRDDNNPNSVAYVISRTITLKSSPTSMCLGRDDDDLLVSTVDRSICQYSIKTGQAGFNFKCSDPDGGEAAAMSKVQYAPSLNGNPTIVGVSSGDKSVRLYSDYGSLISRDWGHTEGITDVALLPTKPSHKEPQDGRDQLVTVALDSTIFIWDTATPAAPKEPLPDANGIADTPTKPATPMPPPLRKVLSQSELSRFKRQKSIEGEEDPPTPTVSTPTSVTQPPSPQRIKKKSSRTSVAQPPRLEPAFRSNFNGSSRRKSLRQRSPSPPSPQSKAPKDLNRKPSLGMSLRSKSSENVLSSYASNSNPPNNTSAFGSLTSSTESVCRTLRAYRKKLANSSTSDKIAADVFRELEKELKLTARVVGEKSQGRNIDEAVMTKLLDEAGDKIVSRLDDRIKERVETEVRKSREGSPSNGTISESPAEAQEQGEGQVDADAVAGALERVKLSS